MIRTTFVATLALLLAGSLSAPLSAQTSIPTTTYDFDDGTTQGFASITRPDTYNDEPTNVTSSALFPAAFPPPSGANVLSVGDGDNNSFGLCSAVNISDSFDRTAPGFIDAYVEVKLYVDTSASTTERNVALLAINDGTVSLNEAYYRFGYRNNEIYLQKFDGTAFTTLGQDPALPGTLTIPGWHTFRLTFTGVDQIACTVNGVATSFSPVTDTAPTIDTEIAIGALGFNLSSFDPILMDDFEIEANYVSRDRKSVV